MLILAAQQAGKNSDNQPNQMQMLAPQEKGFALVLGMFGFGFFSYLITY